MPDLHADSAADVKSPRRQLVMTLVLLVSLAILLTVAQDSAFLAAVPAKHHQIVDWVLCLVWFVLGIWLVRHLRHAVFSMATKRMRSDLRVPLLVARLFAAIGYAFVTLVALNMLHIQISAILVGGALTGVIVGIGAQSTLSNLFAGVILFTLRPFTVGQSVNIRTWMFSGIEYQGVVQDINWYYTELLDGGQKRILPNSSIIIAAITVSAKAGQQWFDVSLPYTVSMKTFGDSLSSSTNGQASAAILEFGETSYTVQVHVPHDIDRDAVRDAIARARGMGQASG